MVAVALFVEEVPQEGFSRARGIFKGGSVKLLGIQLLACVVIGGWAMATTWIQLYVIGKIVPLRMSYEEELIGNLPFTRSDFPISLICG